MAANNEEIRIGVAVVSDSSGADKARKELVGVQKAIEDLKGSFSRGEKETADYNKELAALEKQQKALRGAINSVTGEYDTEAVAIKKATEEAKKLAAEQERAASVQPASIGERAQEFGSKMRSLPSIQIPGLGIGTDAIANIVRVGGALADKLAPAAKTGAEAVEAGAAASKGAAAAQAALGATEAVAGAEAGAASVGVGAFVVSLLPIAAIVAPIAAVIGVTAIAFKRLHDEAQGVNDAVNKYADTQRVYNDIIDQGMTTSEAKERLAELEHDKAQEQAIIDKIEGGRSQAFAEASDRFGDGLARLGTSVEEGAGLFNASAEQVKTSKDKIAELNPEIAAYSQALADNAFAANDATTSLEELNQQQQQLSDAVTKDAQQIANYAAQIEQLNDSFQQANNRAAVTSGLKGMFDGIEAIVSANEKAEDAGIAAEEREDAHQKRLGDIQTDGNKRIEELQNQATQKAIDAANEISKLQTDFQKEDAKARARFEEEQLDKQREFRQRQADIDREFERAQDKAIGDQNVRAFIDAQQAKDDAERGLKRDERTNRRDVERFEVERKEAAKTLQEKIDGINTELAAFQTAQQTKVAVELQAITDQQTAETEAYKASEKKITEKEERLEQRAEDRATRREAYEELLGDIQDQWKLDDHNKQLARIEDLKAAAIDRYDKERFALDSTNGAIEKMKGNVDLVKASTDALTNSANAFANVVGSISGKNEWWRELPTPGIGGNQTSSGLALPPPPSIPDGRVMNPNSFAGTNRAGGGFSPNITVNIQGGIDLADKDYVHDIANQAALHIATTLHSNISQAQGGGRI